MIEGKTSHNASNGNCQTKKEERNPTEIKAIFMGQLGEMLLAAGQRLIMEAKAAATHKMVEHPM
jgi:hypothetical protein